MKFFLDENFPKSVTVILETKGHKVFDVRSTEDEGSDDFHIFKLAQDKESIFVTTDKDFFHTIPYLFEKHYGVIVITLRQPDRKSITEKFLFALNHFNLSSFESKILLLKDNIFSIIGE
jgi:predicted nuclease of predicted toxin-antitoxin system